jgi:basic amino acid/polyamine antiporter, APA family
MTLRRVLSAPDAAWIVAGNMIGAGIFVTPGLVAAAVPSAFGILGVWLLGGLLALAGAAVYAELGSRLPYAGGDYRYLAAAFGPLWGFLWGWAAFVLTFSAAAAALAIASIDYLGQAFPLLAGIPEGWKAPAGALLILALTGFNVAGARAAGRATVALTAVPVAGLLLLFGLGLLTGQASMRLPHPLWAAPPTSWAAALGGAMLPVFFTYSGWNAAAYLAGEMRDPEHGLARGLLAGTILVTLLYLLFNLVLLWVLPLSDLAGMPTAGTVAARRLLGPAAERGLALLISIAILGSANVTLMAGARVYYAMAEDRLAPAPLRLVNRAGVPGRALWAGGLWAALLAATGSFARLLSWSTIAILLLSSLAAASIFRLRRQAPRGAPYLCPGYPLTPLAYLAVTLAVLAACLVASPASSVVGLLIVAAGLPVYALARRRSHPPGASPPPPGGVV